MSSVTFKALIDGVHFDPKKGAVKIQLIATSYVSMDKLTSLGPADESVRITLESAQTKIADVRDPTALSPEARVQGEKWLEEGADVLLPNKEDQITSEFPLSEAKGDKDEGEEEEEEEGIGDGLI